MSQLKHCFTFTNVSYSAFKSCFHQASTPPVPCNHNLESESWNNYVYSNVNMYDRE